MPKKKKNKRKFRPNFRRNKAAQTESTDNSEKGTQNIKRRNILQYTWKLTTWATGGFLAMIGLFPTIADSILNRITSSWLYIFIFIASCVWLCNLLWLATNLIAKWRPVNTKIRIITTAVLAFIVILVTSPYYVDIFLGSRGTIEMPTFIDDSTQILVHYGRRLNDFVFTQTTFGELKQKPRAALNVNGQDILYIHIEDNKLYVDAILFGGYKNQAVVNAPLARTRDFSISMYDYFNTDITGDIVREIPGGYIADSETCAKIAEAILSPPVVLKDNVIHNLPNGWEKKVNSKALEIINENNIPVLLVEYKSPYEITISGLFVTSFGLLKVDNSEDVIFKFGSNLSDLGTYKVDKIFNKPIYDLWFRPERTYDLYNIYARGR